MRILKADQAKQGCRCCGAAQPSLLKCLLQPGGQLREVQPASSQRTARLALMMAAAAAADAAAGVFHASMPPSASQALLQAPEPLVSP